MAIRFQCSSCSQPIEVDDEWASRAVACPYCNRTITAPAESTFTDLSDIPTASPVATGQSTAGSPDVSRAPASATNPVAVLSLVLACGVLALLLVAMMISTAHALELEQLAERMQGTSKDFASQLQAFSEFFDARGGEPPNWLMAIVLLELAAVAGCVAAIICGIVGLRHAHRRRFAVAALVISGSVTLLLCANVGFSLGLSA